MEIVKLHQITATSLDDGHRCEYGVYLSFENAQKVCDTFVREQRAKVMPFDAVSDSNGNYYKIETSKIFIQDDIRRIREKLTKEELDILLKAKDTQND